ncbi:MAG: hypothetical protein LVQ95_03240 [Candidatus Micrarchaeales archaeon]|nr:hypothetical protein [Candidatus Micrarchaeales archaeon]
METAMKNKRAQSAIEYLTTYGWAILIIIVVVAALYRLGIFNPTISTTCIFPAEFGCLSAVLYSSNSTLYINVQQSLQTPITITAYGCNNMRTLTNMVVPSPITLGIGGNTTLSMQCYQNGSVVSLLPGQTYSGFVLINYTNLQSGFRHTAQGTLKAKAV